MAVRSARPLRRLFSEMVMVALAVVLLLAPGAGGTARRKLPASASKQARKAFMQWFRQIGGTAEDIALEQVTADGGVGIVANKDIEMEVRPSPRCVGAPVVGTRAFRRCRPEGGEGARHCGDAQLL
jgi:hypothetical protein